MSSILVILQKVQTCSFGKKWLHFGLQEYHETHISYIQMFWIWWYNIYITNKQPKNNLKTKRESKTKPSGEKKLSSPSQSFQPNIPTTSHQTKSPIKQNTRFFVSHHGGGFKRCIAHWQSAALLGIQVPLNHNCTWVMWPWHGSDDMDGDDVHWSGTSFCWEFGLLLFNLTLHFYKQLNFGDLVTSDFVDRHILSRSSIAGWQKMRPLCILLPRFSGLSVQIQVFKLPSFINKHVGFSASRTRVQPAIINSMAHSLLLS